MTHFRVLYIGQDPDADFAPYNEQDEEYFAPRNETKSVRADYKKYGKEYRKKGCRNAVEFAKMWLSIDTVLDKSVLSPEALGIKEARLNGRKERYIVSNGNRLVKVVTFSNPNGNYDYYGLEHNLTETFDYDALIKEAEEKRRKYHQSAVRVLGHIPSFKTVDDIVAELGGDAEMEYEDRIALYQKAGDLYWEQDDVKKLYDAGIGVRDKARTSEEDYVAGATLPFCAIVTDEGWFEQARTGWWGMSGPDTMTDKEWREVERKAVQNALRDRDEFTEVWECDCHI